MLVFTNVLRDIKKKEMICKYVFYMRDIDLQSRPNLK